MKKKLFALTTALVLTFGMAVSVCAAPSAGTGTTTTTTVVSVDQAITDSQACSLAAATTVETSVAGTTITAVSGTTATAVAAKAKELSGSNAAIATIVDLSVPAGTGTADFTLKVSTVKAGQRIYILHQKSDGTWEKIAAKNVADGAVTFTMTSYSPVAIIIENAPETNPVSPAPTAPTAAPAGTAPKTGDAMPMVALLAMVTLAGATVFAKKAAN